VGTGETVRKWVRQAEIDGGVRPGTTSEESDELKRLRRENAELRRANDILKAASASSRPRSTAHRDAQPHQAWTCSLVLATRTAVPISQIARPAWAGKRAANATLSVRASTGPAAA
jgi:hypothetical protein